MTYGELETQTRNVILFVSNTLLVILKEDLTIFFISGVLQESVKNPDVLAAFLTGHSPIIFSVFNKSEGTRGKDLWKHKNSLCEKSTYINGMKKRISTLENLKNENITDEQNVWKYLKYKIKKFSKNFSKEAARSKKIESSAVKTKLKILPKFVIETILNIFTVKKNLTNYIKEKLTVL